MAGNLLAGTGYFLFSGAFNFGDWAAVIHGSQPDWAWRLGLVLAGMVSCYASLMLVGRELKAFQPKVAPSPRIRALCWTPFFSDAILAALGGFFSPPGLFYVIASALPATLGANAGLLSLPFMMRRVKSMAEEPVGAIRRSVQWIAMCAIVGLLFIFVLGRGLTWSH